MESEICKLSSAVIDQIAAGEVVERPANMIKELVENAIDAGSNLVEVEIEEGGRNVVVKDNGHGISQDDLSLALDRHATSKIRKAADLWQIHSFGFRGEALASIAAVSEMQLVSRTKAADSAFRLKSEFGEKQNVEPVGGSVGTTISVQKLFDNVPARKKFLKSEAGEIGQIKHILKALALAHWDVAFKLKVRGRLVHYWPVSTSLQERSEQVLGLEKMYYACGEYEGIRAEVVYSPPHKTFGNSRNVWLFAQNRWIQDRSLQTAVLDAYRGLLMHGEFPYAVVSLQCDPQVIDVNIHPTKSQVKFQNQKSAFRAVQRTLRAALERAPWVEDVLGGDDVRAQGVDSEKSEKVKSASEPFMVPSSVMATSASRGPLNRGGDASAAQPSVKPQQPFSLNFRDPEMQRTQYGVKQMTPSSLESGHVDYQATEVAQTGQQSSSTTDEQPIVRTIENKAAITEFDLSDEKFASQEAADAAADKKVPKWSNLQVLCQANNTYIVAQNSEKLFFVDQHAAHERVAYESLMQVWQGGKVDVQKFLLPLEVEMPEHHVEAVLSFKDDLQKLGIEIEASGPATIIVNSAPVLLKEKGLQETLLKMADDIFDKGDSFAFDRYVGDICATMACHSVVRAGQVLSHEEMKALLKGMDDFPLSTFCPHGRPVFVEYPYGKLERDFGRIV